MMPRTTIPATSFQESGPVGSMPASGVAALRQGLRLVELWVTGSSLTPGAAALLAWRAPTLRRLLPRRSAQAKPHGKVAAPDQPRTDPRRTCSTRAPPSGGAGRRGGAVERPWRGS